MCVCYPGITLACGFAECEGQRRLQTPPSTPDVKVVQRHLAAAKPHSFALNSPVHSSAHLLELCDQKSADSF
jgi:hypothetical protein